MKLTVYHKVIYGNGDYTIFSGPALAYSIESDGSLLVTNWVKNNELGAALFAPKQWICAIAAESETTLECGRS